MPWVYCKAVDWQEITAFAIVALAFGGLVWRMRRKHPLGGASRTCCGCAAGGSRRNSPVLLQGRKGERARITIQS